MTTINQVVVHLKHLRRSGRIVNSIRRSRRVPLNGDAQHEVSQMLEKMADRVYLKFCPKYIPGDQLQLRIEILRDGICYQRVTTDSQLTIMTREAAKSKMLQMLVECAVMERHEYIETHTAVINLARFALALDVDSLRQFIWAINRADTLGPVIDPTLYMQGNEKMHAVGDIAEATIKYIRAVHAAKNRSRSR